MRKDKTKKFCSNCGTKNKVNVIDKKIDYLKSISNDISESKYVSETKNKTIRGIAQIYVFLGYLSILFLLGQLILIAFKDQNLLITNSYLNISEINEPLTYKLLFFC